MNIMQFEGHQRDDLISLSVRTIFPETKPPGMPGEWEFLFESTWKVDIKKSDYPTLSKDKRILSIRLIHERWNENGATKKVLQLVESSFGI